jgi:hypothetical protein
MNNMADDPESFAEAQGVVFGRLQARLPDRIIVGDLALFLPSGTKCDHAIGTALRVTYTQHEGIKQARRVEPAAG